MCICSTFTSRNCSKFIMRRARGVKDQEDEDFTPLRKSLKRKSTGKEDNFMRSYYVENKDLAKLSEADIDEIRWNQSIEIQGEDCPRPIRSFRDLNLPEELQKYLSDHEYTVPTAIQSQALSCVMSGRDIIGLAETGSGKTLSYTLPLCVFLKTRDMCVQGQSPTALVLTPTRELMQQVLEHVTELLRYTKPEVKETVVPYNLGAVCSQNSAVTGQSSYQSWTVTGQTSNVGASCFGPSYSDSMPRGAGMDLSHASFYHASPLESHHVVPTQELPYFPSGPVIPGVGTKPNQQVFPPRFKEFKVVGVCGGVPIAKQVHEMRQGVDVIIATPGRLLDLCERGLVTLDKVSYLVMDEADRMLGMGMEEQLRKIVGLATGTIRARQTLLWSATMPESLQRLARSAVLNPITIQVGPAGVISPTIQQNVSFMYHYEKPKKLLQVLRSTPYPPVMVFASSIQNVDYVVELLKKEQFHVSGLHSQKSQDYRFRLVSAYRDGKVDVLVATDVASRGLDFPEVTQVINYDLPVTIEDYVHRCGRTGRMGRSGLATSFLTLDCKIAEELKEMLEIMEQPVPKELDDLRQFGKKIIRTEFGDRVIDH